MFVEKWIVITFGYLHVQPYEVREFRSCSDKLYHASQHEKEPRFCAPYISVVHNAAVAEVTDL